MKETDLIEPERMINMTTDELDAYLALMEQEAHQFESEVEGFLSELGPVTNPERFDLIADRIATIVPNTQGFFLGIRALGKHYAKSCRDNLNPEP